MAAKNKLQKGLSFKNRHGEKYKFDNDEEYKMVIEPSKPAPFPDIAAETPGVLTEREEVFGVCVCVCVSWSPVKGVQVVKHTIPIANSCPH